MVRDGIPCPSLLGQDTRFDPVGNISIVAIIKQTIKVPATGQDGLHEGALSSMTMAEVKVPTHTILTRV